MGTSGRSITIRRVLLSVLVPGCLGFIGNYFGQELFLNVEFLFGSIFSTLALMRFGPASGVITAIIASSSTFLTWHHPWAAVIFCCEAVFLACFFGRRSRNIVLLDVIFWAVLGAPLVWGFYHGLLERPVLSTTLIMLKQAVNGILNVVIAAIVQLVVQYRQHVEKRLPRLRHLVFVSMVALLLTLVLTDLFVDARLTMRAGQADLVERSTYLTAVTQKTISAWLDEHLEDVGTLARLVGDPDKSSLALMQQQTETVQAASSSFRTMGVMNRNAVSITCSPLLDENGTSCVGLDFSDRPYIPLLENGLQPHVTDLIMGRIGRPAPILALLAPLVIDGTYKGFCAGSVDFSELRKLLETLVGKQTAHITLVDRNQRVIASTRPELATMEHFVRPEGSTSRRISTEVYHWLPPAVPGESIMQHWTRSLFVQETPLKYTVAWSVIVEQSMVPLLDELTRDSINRLLLAAVLIILSVGISHLLSRGLVRTLWELKAVTEALPQRLQASSPERWPKSGISEVDGLIRNFRRMVRALQNSFQELQTLNESLEERIKQRTGELAESEQRYRLLADNAGDLIFRYRLYPDHACIYTSPSSQQILGYAPEEYYADVNLQLKIVHPDDLHVLKYTEAGREIPSGHVLRWMHKEGRIVWMDTRLTRVSSQEDSIEIIGISRDISEQKHREELSARLEAEQNRLQLMEKEQEHLRENEMLMKDLHDGIGGIITNIAMLGQYAMLRERSGQGDEILPKIVELASAGVTEMRSFMNSTENRNSAWGDLLAEVKEFAAKMLDPHGIRLEVTSELLVPSLPLDSFRYVNLIRICREIITNIVKHAAAHTVRIDFFTTTTHFMLSIADDGIGYDQARIKSRGTGNIQVRADQIGAVLSIVSEQGTIIRLSLPLCRHTEQEEKCD